MSDRSTLYPLARITAVAGAVSLGAMSPVFAQTTPGTGGGSNTVTTPTVPTATPSQGAQQTPIGASLSTPSPAVPTPNPNLAASAALPERRGFVRAEPFFIYPWVGVGVGHNSNITGVSTNPIASSFLVLTPRIAAEAKGGGHTHTLAYAGSYGRYFNSKADNYNDHEVTLNSVNQFSSRADFTGSVFYLDRVDPRGLLARPQSDEPDHYTAWGASGTFGYGARNAQGRFEGEFGLTDKAYDNNRLVTEAFDVASMSAAGRFLYRVGPRTRLLAELRATEFDYKTSNRDNLELRYLAGATWDLAAATTGTVKAGWMTKRYKDSSVQDFSGASLEAAVRWTPRTYSTVDLVARQGAVDTGGFGLYTIDSSLGASWTHRWSPFLSTRSSLTYTKSDFRGITRTDDLVSLQIGAFTDIRTWLRVGVDYQNFRRSSTDSTVSFDRDVVMFTVGATL